VQHGVKATHAKDIERMSCPNRNKFFVDVGGSKLHSANQYEKKLEKAFPSLSVYF
jgi:hypothetical protein